jgi:hypothetical protein
MSHEVIAASGVDWSTATVVPVVLFAVVAPPVPVAPESVGDGLAADVV